MKKLFRVPTDAKDFRYAWAVSIIIAVLSAPFLLMFKDSKPWLIIVPITLGSLVVFVVEVQAAFSGAYEVDKIKATFQGNVPVMNFQKTEKVHFPADKLAFATFVGVITCLPPQINKQPFQPNIEQSVPKAP